MKDVELTCLRRWCRGGSCGRCCCGRWGRCRCRGWSRGHCCRSTCRRCGTRWCCCFSRSNKRSETDSDSPSTELTRCLAGGGSRSWKSETVINDISRERTLLVAVVVVSVVAMKFKIEYFNENDEDRTCHGSCARPRCCWRRRFVQQKSDEQSSNTNKKQQGSKNQSYTTACRTAKTSFTTATTKYLSIFFSLLIRQIRRFSPPSRWQLIDKLSRAVLLRIVFFSRRDDGTRFQFIGRSFSIVERSACRRKGRILIARERWEWEIKKHA